MRIPVPADRFERMVALGALHSVNSVAGQRAIFRRAVPAVLGIAGPFLASGGRITLVAIVGGLLVAAVAAVAVEALRPRCTVLPISVPKVPGETGWARQGCARRVAGILRQLNDGAAAATVRRPG